MMYGLCKIFVNNYKDNYVIRFCDGSFILIIEMQDFYARFFYELQKLDRYMVLCQIF